MAQYPWIRFHIRNNYTFINTFSAILFVIYQIIYPRQKINSLVKKGINFCVERSMWIFSVISTKGQGQGRS